MFSTCGNTGDKAPSQGDCDLYHAQNPTASSVVASFMEQKWGFQVFTAPINGNYEWTLRGAQGGDDNTCCHHHRNSWNRYGKGGLGGRVVATHAVKAGTKFYIRVGQKGYDCWATKSGMRDPAGAKKYKHCEYNPSKYGPWDNGHPWTSVRANLSALFTTWRNRSTLSACAPLRRDKASAHKQENNLTQTLTTMLLDSFLRWTPGTRASTRAVVSTVSLHSPALPAQASVQPG